MSKKSTTQDDDNPKLTEGRLRKNPNFDELSPWEQRRLLAIKEQRRSHNFDIHPQARASSIEEMARSGHGKLSKVFYDLPEVNAQTLTPDIAKSVWPSLRKLYKESIGGYYHQELNGYLQESDWRDLLHAIKDRASDTPVSKRDEYCLNSLGAIFIQMATDFPHLTRRLNNAADKIMSAMQQERYL